MSLSRWQFLLILDGMALGTTKQEAWVIKSLSLILPSVNEVPRLRKLLNFSAKYWYLFLIVVIQQPPVQMNHRKSQKAECGSHHCQGHQAVIMVRDITWHQPSSRALGTNITSISPSGHHHSSHGCLVLALRVRTHQGQDCSLDT